MAEKPETRLIRKTLTVLRKHGAWVFKVHGDPYQPVVIDLIGNMAGFFFALEGKMPGQEPTELQKHTMEQIRGTGGITGVFHTPEEALQILEREIAGFYALAD